MGRWVGRGTNGKVYGAISRARERREGMWGDEEVYGSISRAWDQWGGLYGDGRGARAIGRYQER